MQHRGLNQAFVRFKKAQQKANILIDGARMEVQARENSQNSFFGNMTTVLPLLSLVDYHARLFLFG